MVLFLPLPLRAQEEAPLLIEAHALYDGTSKYGEWLPVVVGLQNNGTDIRGRVQVRIEGSSNQEAIYAQPLELPRGARKEVTIYTIPNNFSRRLLVEFVPEGNAADEAVVATEVEIMPVRNIRFMAAAITGGGQGLQALGGVNFRGERREDRAILVPLTLETLPERPEALRTVDLLILTGVDTSTLTPRQQAALEQYVVLGGMLVLGGGADAKRVMAGIPESLHPVSLVNEVKLDALDSLNYLTGQPVRVNGPFPAAHAVPLRDSLVRLYESTLPLIVEREVGHGAVYWLALDPSLTPFDAWTGVEEFWLALLAERARFPIDLPPDAAPRQFMNYELYSAVQNLPSLDLPELQLLIPLLIIYILIVGPVNYFILRRRKRLELAWATIPAVTFVFSLGAYGLGFQLRGSDILINQVAVVEAMPASEAAYIRSMIGLFSPRQETYDLFVEGNALLSPAELVSDPYDNRNNRRSEGILMQGEPSFVQDMNINQWSMQTVMAESLALSGYGFEAELQTADNKLSGSITNGSDYLWKDVVIVLGHEYVQLGNIPAGSSKEVELPYSQEIKQINNRELPEELFPYQYNQNNLSREREVRRQVLSSLYNNRSGSTNISPIANSRAPVLLAWLDEPSLEVTISNTSLPNQRSTTLLYAELPVRFGKGQISLPRGMIRGQIISNDGGICYDSSTISLSPDFREAEIEFELPSNVKGIDLSRLLLYVSTNGGQFTAPSLMFFNHQEQLWREQPRVVLGRNSIEQPDAFLSQSGRIRMRVQNPNPNPNNGNCLFFQLALEGSLS
jgi:hypothetical protein